MSQLPQKVDPPASQVSTKEQLLEAGGGYIFGVVCFGDFSRVAVKPTRCAGFSELGWGNERLNTAPGLQERIRS